MASSTFIKEAIYCIVACRPAVLSSTIFSSLDKNALMALMMLFAAVSFGKYFLRNVVTGVMVALVFFMYSLTCLIFSGSPSAILFEIVVARVSNTLENHFPIPGSGTGSSAMIALAAFIYAVGAAKDFAKQIAAKTTTMLCIIFALKVDQLWRSAS